MKILLLGGTGAMGSHLSEILSSNGVETYVTSRKENTEKENLHYYKGNAYNSEFLQNILNSQAWDVIVDFMVYNTQTFEERIEQLLNATKQYVFLSSARVYANSDKALTEGAPRLLDTSKDTEYTTTDEYALTKARQENLLKKSGKSNWTIIRPYITYSEARLQLGVLEKEEWLYRAMHGRTIVFSREMMNKVTTLTYGFDVAASIAKLTGNPKALGETFHITANQTITWEDVLTTYTLILKKYLGQPPKVLLLEFDDFIMTKRSKYQICYDRFYNRIFDNSKVAHYVDISSFKQPASGLIECLDFFCAKPQFLNIDWKSEAIKDRYTKEYTSLKEIKSVKSKIKYLIFRHFPLT